MASINPTGTNSIGAALLPNFYNTDANKKFVQATIDQLMQPGTVSKINGYIGRENAKAATGNDVYVTAADAVRQNYQLEPSLTVQDSIGNTTFFKDYIDYINQIGVFGGNTANHSRLNKQEFYSWDPHINWDMVVNFQNYYWLPYGPETITIYGHQLPAISTYTVNLQLEGVDNQYVFTPDGNTPNPLLKLYRGQTFKFNINSPGNPFSIMTARGQGATNRYLITGIDQYGVEDGTITFTVPEDAPSLLFYQSETDENVGGAIEVFDVADNAYLDVENDILGKVTYTTPDGLALSNGMKIAFGGLVAPNSYASSEYYVEGVGTAIKLINKSILEVVSTYSTPQTILFDETAFDTEPFSDANNFAQTLDYITINRASNDHNPWSRYNRWYHKDVISTSLTYNGNAISLDQTVRAIRPIIEFQADLKLFNFGTQAVQDVNLIDTYTTDVFLTIEGTKGYNVDGVPLSDGQRILFAADVDPLVANNIYQVSFINISGYRQIHLTKVSEPVVNQTLLVTQGKKYLGQMFWYNGTAWQMAQQKTAVNQSPLFDTVDSNGASFGDSSVYPGTTFTGTSIFSYKIGTGVADTSLGFPLTYKNISNIGDIVFNFDLATDTFQYKQSSALVTKNVNLGYLLGQDYTGNQVHLNGWQICKATNTQAAIRIYKNSNKVNNFSIDIFDDITNLIDLVVRVYINGVRLNFNSWEIIDAPVYKTLVLTADILPTDVLTIKAFASQPINSNGYYEIPVNLQNNPLNGIIGDFTLGELNDHLTSIIDNIPPSMFDGVHIKDLGNITKYGTKFVQHSGPASLSLYHIASQSNNIVRAIEQSRDDYNKFKRNFVAFAERLGIDSDPVSQVDLILQKINENKPNTDPYYFSDMVPYGAKIVTDLAVVDSRIKTYPLTNVFDLNILSNKAVGVYLNSTQLLYGRDYTFSNQGFIVVDASVTLTIGDTIRTVEYESTDGSFIAETPTKLGIWPKFEPQIYLDTSLVSPVLMIQGHDGSQIAAYGDYRDEIILELEKRIFNNIKVTYDPSIYDIADIVPSYNRTNSYSIDEFNQVLSPSFYKWANLTNSDFTKPLNFDGNNPFTYNYVGHSAPDGRNVPGYWRGIYRWMYDTDRPNICPWEMLGFSIQPSWWVSVYGPAPYTSDNLVMWQDIASGLVRQPGIPVTKLAKYVKPFLMSHLPVDDSGNLVNPLVSGLATGAVTTQSTSGYVFGDVSPVEAAWRRSSHYPFSVLITSMLLTPANTLGVLLDRSRIIRDVTGQLIYKDTGLRIRPMDVILPSIYSSTSRVQTAGIINYIVNYILSDNLLSYSSYGYDLANLNANLSYRVGAFTSKDKFNLLLDSKSPSNTGSVFVPQENISIVLNSSSPIQKITYSGIIISKLSDGFEIKGYSQTQPYFKYFSYTQNGPTVNVGGISETYTTWTPGQQYVVGAIIRNNGIYYRTTASTTAGATFDPTFFATLSALPIIGGVDAIFRKAWDKTAVNTAPYGTKFGTVQEVVDFIMGYGEYLKSQGFVFDDFNANLSLVANWETSAKEFMFWSTQNWSSGQEKWADWEPGVAVQFNTIVRYNGDYYSAIKNVPASNIFLSESFTKLDGLSTVGSSVISLSPSANKLTFNTTLSVVDNISNPFNNYEIFKVDATPIAPNFLNSYREGNTVSYSPRTDDGIYGASFYLIQNEQVIILSNSTMFNDTIYNPESGYRQERIKVSSYVSTNWYGGFDIPGFIFDRALVQDWQPWTDYALGDTVKYQTFYYSANSFIPGAASFVATDWRKLSTVPSPQLLPNWTNVATQFTDFYSLNTESFDSAQQTIAQHLIGYQKRQYLSNIIQDDVSEYKFYQGMIRDKGTENVFNKLFDVLSADNKESLNFFEEWALRVGQYGASNAFENIEFVLDAASFKNNPQGFELVNSKLSSVYDLIIRQTPNDVYVKPLGYNSSPFPVVLDYNPLLRSAGYVRASDVFSTLPSIDNIVSQDITQFRDGTYIWCTFEGASWNVYRYTDVGIKVTGVTYSGTTVTVTTKNLLTLKAGTYIGLAQIGLLQGFYKIQTVSLNTFTLTATIQGFPTPFTQAAELVVYALVSQRTSSIDTIDTILPLTLNNGELLWTDNSGSGTWAVWKYAPVYSKTPIINYSTSTQQGYGRFLAIATNGKIAATATNAGLVITYDRASQIQSWIQRQTIQAPFIEPYGYNLISNLATTIAFSPDGAWMATSSPLASGGYTKLKGAWISSDTYAKNDIVSVTTTSVTYYQALSAVPTNTPTTNLQYWEKLAYLPINASGTSIGLTSHGVVSLYYKDSNNIYSLVDTILSPIPANNELFGSSLAFGKNSLYVGAVGTTNNTGKVYKLSYKTTLAASSAYNPVGSLGTTLVITSTAGIQPGMIVQGNGFTDQQTVVSVVNATTLTLSGVANGTPSGIINFVTIGWGYDLPGSFSGIAVNSRFGSAISLSNDESTLVISASGGTINSKVFVYKAASSEFVLLQTISGINTTFGASTAITTDGDHLVIADNRAARSKIDQGAVIIYVIGTNNQYSIYQELVNHHPESSGYFGSNVAFMNDTTLAVFSSNESTSLSTTFDKTATSFDKGSTSFVQVHLGSGRIDVYDNYSTKWVFSETLSTDNVSGDGYGLGFAVGSNQIFVGAPYALNNNVKAGQIFSYSKLSGSYSWSVFHEQADIPDVSKIKKAFLYNKVTNQLVDYIDVIDPLQGKIPGIAEEELQYKAFYDPAVYTIGDINLVNVDDSTAWGVAQVGQLWWDLRTAKFINSYDSDVVYKNSNWSTLAVGASIDVYEWVSTTLLPSAWDTQADTDAGLALGISGKSLYGNTSYSIRKRFDTVSQTFKNTYYFWVKNKAIVPNIAGRNMSASSVAALIANPRGQGYQYLALTGLNSFSLANVQSSLSSNDVVLSIEYWLIDNTEQNVHSQWKIISEDPTVDLPNTIEQKWFDSLCGKDAAGRAVPDTALPAKLKYGIENRPRQGMFVNRFEALKQVIEQANLFLISNQIVGYYDLTSLETYDTPPSTISGLYDTTENTDAELAFASIGSFKTPTLTPQIVDGRIVGVTIVVPGQGFLIAPYINIVGTGTGAVVRAIINSTGQITGATIIKSGEGYTSSTTCSVRNYSVLVLNDSQADGAWSIYSYDNTYQVWSRSLTQSYDVRKYWFYANWFATGFNQFSAADYLINTFADLSLISPAVGQLVKIKVANTGGWQLLHCYAISNSNDWTQTYNVVGVENGTIQFSSSLYQFTNTGIGYDGSTYDGIMFDTVASIELRYILNAIKDKIFINDLKGNYLNLFFTSVRYVLSEQNYVDWIFKTSFVKAQHNVGNLDQPVTYKPDNLSNFQDYIAEVKPYRTTIREYVSNYSDVDPGNMAISDFDLPPVYENGKNTSLSPYVINGKIVSDDTAINSYPWKNWLDNVGFVVTELRLTSGGSGYITEPIVTITSDSGSGATGRAFFSNGVINRIILLTPGSNYLSAPTVTITGGLAKNGIAATAIAVIGDSVIRSNLIKIKFDRTTQSYVLSQVNQVETLTGISGKIQYSLAWAPDVRVGQSSVTINGIPVLRELYTLSIVSSNTSGYTQYSGKITFASAPAAGATIIVHYAKDWSVLNASDRIQFYYNPETGDLGKDLTQLMTGVDYGGVIVDGLGFDVNFGWGSVPYYSDKWDTFDATFSDYIVVVSAGTHSFTLPSAPPAGTVMNVYYINNTAGLSSVRIDDPNYGTGSQTNPSAVMVSPVADGSTTVFTIPNTVTVYAGDEFIWRYSTSDGSIAPNTDDYDTALIGGNLAYSTATGLLADDILVDGDGFVTSTTSPAPEEVVPGQVVDTVAIKVYDQPSSGAANIKIDNYLADGIATHYKIGQQPNSSQAVIVKVGTLVLTQGTDYTVDYKNKNVNFTVAPVLNSTVSIFSIGFNGADILDIDYFIGDGTTLEFLTKAPWLSPVTSLVYVDGVVASPELFKTTSSYASANLIGLRFTRPPALGAVVSYTIVNGAQQTFAVTKKEKVLTNGNLSYTLQYPIGNSLPAESNMIVRVDQSILQSPVNSYYTIKNSVLAYTLDFTKFLPYSVSIENIEVLANNTLLTLGKDYTVDLSGITITISQLVYNKYVNDQLVIIVTSTEGYTYNSATNTITFAQAYDNTHVVEVISSYNHDILDIERTAVNITTSLTVTPGTVEFYYYKGVTSGIIPLDRSVINDDYIWVIKNSTLLVPSVDYKLNDNHQSITLAIAPAVGDQITLMTFGSNVLTSGIAYMQFKDMLNRVIFKRLSLNKRTQLVQDLNFNDTTIVVTDTSNFDIPNPAQNKPGIVEIRGERIEYFNITGNTLGQLRRGTLGTGVTLVHRAGAYVQDIGPSETIPYTETPVSEQIIADGTSKSYTLSMGVTLDSTFNKQNSLFEVFVGGNSDIVRLKKSAYSLFDITKAPYSPAGDVSYPADFAISNITGTTAVLGLTNTVAEGTRITVVKRTGIAWDSSLNILQDNSEIANFLKATPGIWYTDFKQ
jgi:hypothetical protein